MQALITSNTIKNELNRSKPMNEWVNLEVGIDKVVPVTSYH